MRRVARVVALVVVFRAGHAAAEGDDAIVTARAAAALDRGGCIDCHSASGVASDTRLVFPAAGAAPARDAEFGDWLLELVDRDAPARSKLLLKPTGRTKHAGGERLAPGSDDDKALAAWVARLAARADGGVAARVLASVRRPAGERAGRVLRRLTARQLDNAVRDLLGDVSGAARELPAEDFVDGFRNQSAGQGATAGLIEAYGVTAAKLAANAVWSIGVGDPTHVLPCAANARNAACRDRFVRELGRRAFHRPLAEGEVARFVRLFDVAWAHRAASFLDGVAVVLEAMLQSPSFLYLPDDAVPGPWARASRLSLLLWNAPPDAALLDEAATGALDTPAGLERVATKMLDDPRARTAVDEFVGEWLRLDMVTGAFKEGRAFPEWNAELARAMAEETRRLVRELVWNDRDFRELFTADYTFATEKLAAVYGLPAPATPFARVAYPPSSERSGVLGHGSFLAATSKPSETSPTARGLFIREHFLCQTVPPPPPSVNMDLPAFANGRPLTNRERLAQHLTNESCAGCHRLVDGIGFGFEKFDAIGRRQEVLRVRAAPPTPMAQDAAPDAKPAKREPAKLVDLPIDTRGSILGIANSAFTEPRQIGRVLAGNDQCQRCIVKQLFRWAMGRVEGPADEPVLARAYEEFRASGFRFRRLLVALAKATELAPQPAATERAAAAAPRGDRG